MLITQLQGFRTLQDLKDADVLNRVQLIGVKYFDEFIERMQREEVAEIEAKASPKGHCTEIYNLLWRKLA